MTRHVLIHAADQPARVVAEAALPTESVLHDALTSHPELIPTSDFGMGQAVVVGRESGLTSGYADLILVDDRGQICLIEVKNAGNADTRRVVAQLLDYAASLWGASVAEFEARVLHKFLESNGRTGVLPGVGEYVTELVGSADDDPALTAERIVEQLGQALAAGEFALVLAAPEIPVGVQRVLEYLNARGQRFYGLEVSYFQGPVDCFVPRLVVKPLTSDPGGRPSSTRTQSMDRRDYLAELPERSRPGIEAFLNACEDAGAEILWRKHGPSIAVAREQQRQVGYLDLKRLSITTVAPADFPGEPFQTAKARLEADNVGLATKGAWYRTISLEDAPSATLDTAFEIALGLVRSLVPAVAFATLAEPISVQFQRTDYNVWERQVPGLAHCHGQYLRGLLIHVASGRKAQVQLAPLAQGQPGWKPSFRPASARLELWTEASVGESFRLELEATGRPDTTGSS